MPAICEDGVLSMADVININRARKVRDRAAKAQKAVENRARFGRTKAEKAADAAEKARTERQLDQAKRDQAGLAGPVPPPQSHTNPSPTPAPPRSNR